MESKYCEYYKPSTGDVNHYIIRSYRFVIVVTRSIIRRTIKAHIILKTYNCIKNI